MGWIIDVPNGNAHRTDAEPVVIVSNVGRSLEVPEVSERGNTAR